MRFFFRSCFIFVCSRVSLGTLWWLFRKKRLILLVLSVVGTLWVKIYGRKKMKMERSDIEMRFEWQIEKETVVDAYLCIDLKPTFICEIVLKLFYYILFFLPKESIIIFLLRLSTSIFSNHFINTSILIGLWN